MNSTAMNSTMTTPGYSHSAAEHLHSTLGAAFFGFAAGAMLVPCYPSVSVDGAQHDALDYTESLSDRHISTTQLLVLSIHYSGS